MRDEIAKHIICAVQNEPSIPASNISRRTHHNSNYKNGLYFIYNSNDEIIYVGCISNEKTSSLYMRIIGNGKSAHVNKDWWKHANHIKFHKFEDYNKTQLFIAERLAIHKTNQPPYNDIDTSHNNLSQYSW